ncbi:MAG: hypothetical protein J7L61_03370 [Thermoplasmata archaeon]|nr:hypothetical protein [Thermoplasmata archaeon]
MRTISSGIPGLDEVLRGGFFKPSVVMVAGPAGSGKTTFVMQSLFNVGKKGIKGLFMPTISEPVAMVNNYMAQYGFYDLAPFEKHILEFKDLSSYISAGWKESVEAIREALERYSPEWVVIDPLTVLGYGMEDMERRNFLNELFATLKGWDTMVLVTGEFTRDRLMESPYSYMVDGIIFLDMDREAYPGSRSLEVVKLRGKNVIPGRHLFRIEEEGIRVYPRIMPSKEMDFSLVERVRVSTGIPGYDEMLGGGLLRGSTNLLVGSPGTGKTIFALSFLSAGLRQGEKGVMAVFEESPAKIIRDGEGMGLPVKRWVDEGRLELLYYPPGDSHPDEVTWGIRNAVEDREASRVVMDSLSGFGAMVGGERRMNIYLSNLDSYLSSHGVTTLLTAGLPELGGEGVGGIRQAAVMDSITLLRYVEFESKVDRFLAVLMMKGSDHQKEIREYTISKEGVKVLEKFEGLEGLLSGTARRTMTDTHRILREALPESQRHLLELDKEEDGGDRG